ncbi:hypothetical protein P4O66_014007 [Electrophorus voltai]|uniref:Uncharacterized protein n=1 Tax=Electrophorus voltai TaxID=2609070 RepID=A0AAD9DQM8_9TELE|nr:hypothetical protein P4O66_014007 [Electrophorus voltai]
MSTSVMVPVRCIVLQGLHGEDVRRNRQEIYIGGSRSEAGLALRVNLLQITHNAPNQSSPVPLNSTVKMPVAMTSAVNPREPQRNIDNMPDAVGNMFSEDRNFTGDCSHVASVLIRCHSCRLVYKHANYIGRQHVLRRAGTQTAWAYGGGAAGPARVRASALQERDVVLPAQEVQDLQGGDGNRPHEVQEHETHHGLLVLDKTDQNLLTM